MTLIAKNYPLIRAASFCLAEQRSFDYQLFSLFSNQAYFFPVTLNPDKRMDNEMKIAYEGTKL